MYKIEEIDLINEIGEKLLVRALSNAYFLMCKSPIIYQTKDVKKAQSDLTFIQEKSGIHKIVTTFGLYYDPEKLQNHFYYCVHIA